MTKKSQEQRKLHKFRERELLDEFRDYIDATYEGHYSFGREFQALEFVIDSGLGVGFTLGNVMKYAQRYGHKGDVQQHRKDLFKIIHYAFLALYVHDKENDSADK